MAVVRGRANVDFTDENLAGLGVPYTSFEPRKSSAGIRNIEISLESGKKSVASRLKSNVIELNITPQNVPADIPTTNFVIDPAKLVCFYGREHFLSNYYTAPMTVNNVAYRTVEHYYEACKLFSFGGFQWSSQLNIIKDPGAVKVTGKRLMAFIDKRRVEAWKRSEGLAVIENALIHKFVQHSELGDKLLETGDAYLAHCNPYDTLWGTGLKAEQVKQWATTNSGTTVKIPRSVNAKTFQYFPSVGNGQNALGYLLMQIREAIKRKREKLTAAGILAPNDLTAGDQAEGGENDVNDDQSDSSDVVELKEQQTGTGAVGTGKNESGTGTAGKSVGSSTGTKLSPENTKALEDISYKMALAKISLNQS